MGLFSNLLDTYEKCSTVVGITSVDKNGNPDEKKTFLPIFHMTFKSQVCVIIDENGNFLDISRDPQDQTIIIPCSEKSASRSSGISSHPLCDQLAYVDKDLIPEKFKAFKNNLEAWKGNNIKLNAIYNYLIHNSVVEAMHHAKLFKETEIKKAGEEIPNFEKIAKIGIRFSVRVPGDLVPNVWEDKSLRELWAESQSETKDVQGFDYLSGKKLTKIASNHPKNINSATGNAKLMSCNDTVGFTFRGRFTEQDEAIQIDTITSQKTHTTLKWLINNYGNSIDTQVIVIWAVDQNTEEQIKPFDSSYDLFSTLSKIDTDQSKLSIVGLEIDANYSKKVSDVLRGYGSIKKIKEHSKKIVIAIFDAATTGRMGVTFYQEFLQNQYYENLAQWHEDSSWYLTAFVREKAANEKEIIKTVPYVGCPSFRDILEASYGKPRGTNDNGYNILKKKIRKQLIECMFGNFSFPKSLVDMAAVRASHPMSFTIDNYQTDSNDWRKTINGLSTFF